MKNTLTDEELAFLARHGLAPDDVYDARDLPSAFWKRAIKHENKKVVLGTACGAAGHRLRTRAGHCVQCDPKKLAFEARYSADQYVYIAGTALAELIKIGTCVDIYQREHQMRAEQYGNTRDWEILYYVKARRAGEIEHRARSKLSRHIVVRSYWKDNQSQDAIELLQCSFSQAMQALDAVIADSMIGASWTSRYTDRYEFAQAEEEAS